MQFSNYHTHCKYDDGQGEIKDIVSSAIKHNIKDLGFSCHAPLPFNPPWTMKIDDYNKYSDDLENASKTFPDINIFKGLEVDYIPEISNPKHHTILEKNLDYTIGAVHALGDPYGDNFVPITGNSTKFENNLKSKMDGDVKYAVEEYFRLLSDMIINYPPDILAHIDLIKKINVNYILFNESSVWYKNLIFDCLHLLKNKDIVIEINTGALTRKKAKDLFPSDYIIHEIIRENMPVTVNSDSHDEKNVAGLFNETYDKLVKMGLKSVYKMKNQVWQAIEIV